MRRLDSTPTATGTFSMGSKRKTHFTHVERDFLAHNINADEFDALVDEGYDDIVVITPKARYIASIDEWLDFGYIDLDGDTEVRVLHRSYMGGV